MLIDRGRGLFQRWNLAPLLLACAAVASLTVLAMANAGIGLLVVVLTFALAALPLLRAEQREVVAISVGIALLLSPSSVYLGAESAAMAVVLRGVGVGCFALVAWASPRFNRKPLQFGHWRWAVVAPLGVFVCVTTLPHGLMSDFFTYGAGLLLLTLFLAALVRIGYRELLSAAALSFSLALSASLLLGVVDPGSAVEGARLRGVFENANTLGFVAFLAIALAVFDKVSAVQRAALMTIASICLVWTGSRASLLAVLVVAAGWILTRNVVLGLFVLAGAVLIASNTFDSVAASHPALQTLLRDENSREGSLVTALSDWRESPIVGVGLDREAAIIASSPLRALAQGGFVGFLSIVFLSASFVVMAARAGRPAFWLSVAAIVHSLFEGWLLSPVAPLLMVFLVVWWGFIGSGIATRSGDR